MLIVLHFLLTVPVLFALCLIDHLDWADILLSTIFYPTGLLANNCDWFAGMLNWQWAALESLFGHPKSGFIFGPLDVILSD